MWLLLLDGGGDAPESANRRSHSGHGHRHGGHLGGKEQSANSTAAAPRADQKEPQGI